MSHDAGHNGDRATAVIPARLERRARRLLAAGATFEETLDELHRRGAEQLSLKAVQDFFRFNPAVQRERIERRRQAVEELKQALTGPDGLHRSLAETALFIGLIGSVIGGWMAAGEPMTFTHYRTRRPLMRHSV